LDGPGDRGSSVFRAIRPAQTQLPQRLANDEVVQDLVDTGNAPRQRANILSGIAFQDSLEANAVGNSANDQRRNLKSWLGAESAVNSLLEPVRRLKALRAALFGRFQEARRTNPDGATVSHPRLLSGRCRAATLCVVRANSNITSLICVWLIREYEPRKSALDQPISSPSPLWPAHPLPPPQLEEFARQ
jgi:hypothetical protein